MAMHMRMELGDAQSESDYESSFVEEDEDEDASEAGDDDDDDQEEVLYGSDGEVAGIGAIFFQCLRDGGHALRCRRSEICKLVILPGQQSVESVYLHVLLDRRRSEIHQLGILSTQYVRWRRARKF